LFFEKIHSKLFSKIFHEAVDFYNSAHPSDRHLKANSLKQNAKMYGFMIKGSGSGLYALIDS